MITLDIFNNDAFSLQTLSKSMVDLPFQPTRISSLGLFTEESITTTSLSIERQGTTISLIPAAQRGSSGRVETNDKRSMRSINTVHLPQRGAVLADQVQNLRAFGTESDVELVQGVVNKLLTKLRRNIDTTLEYQRIGAIKGQVLDSDGSTVLLDMFDTFGLTQTTHDLVLDSDATKVIIKIVEAKRKIEDALGGLIYTGLRALCSQEFFDALVAHPAVEKAYLNWAQQGGQFISQDNRSGFTWGGVVWEEYRGTVGNTRFIEANSAYLIPEGVSDLFVTHFAPADYMETVNTPGLPYYAKQELMKMGKGVEIETQSNTISICTRPNAVAKLTI